MPCVQRTLTPTALRAVDPLPERERVKRGDTHGKTRHAVSAPLALLHLHQIHGAHRRDPAHLLHRLLAGDIMTRERLYLFDTTLRDGAQTNGVDFTLADKLAIAGMLDDLGIDYVEGGYPGANPIDTQFFVEERKLGATFTAFGMTRRPGRSTSNDPGLAALLAAK